MRNWRKEVSKILEEKPFEMMEIFEEMYDDWGESIEEYLCQHIMNEKQYEKYTKYIKNFDDTHGPHWSVEQIKEKSGLDFSTKKYTCFDFAYVVNMFYSDFGDIWEAEKIFKASKRWLEDKDSGIKDASTRAYKDGKARYNRFKLEV